MTLIDKEKLTYQLKWAWSLTRNHRGALMAYLILELGVILLSLLFIYWSKEAIDFAISQSSAPLKRTLILAIAAVFLGLVLRTYSYWLNENTRIALLTFLQKKVVRAQMLSRWEVVRKWKTGDIQVRVQNDCREIVQVVGNSAIGAVLTLIRLLASFAFLWVMDPMLALIIIAIIPLFAFSKIYFRKLRRLNHELKTAESSFGHTLLENIRFRNNIRALDLFALRWQRVEEDQNRIVGLRKSLVNFSAGSQALMRMAVNVGFLTTFVWGVYRLYTAEISFGTMTAFLQLVSRVQSPVLALMAFVPQFIRFRTSVHRVVESMEVEGEELGTQEVLPSLRKVTLENIRFKYEDAYVLEGMEAAFEQGMPTAVLGASGKGKTTLIRLMLALFTPESGQITLWDEKGGHELTAAHRANIAYVPQGNSLFTGTVRENLSLNKSDLTDDEIKKALYLSCAEFVYDLPEGLETHLGESGYGLSEGQAQRIALARALVKPRKIWLFDEVTSALDKQTAKKMTERLMEEGKDNIMVFVTHDWKLAEMCAKTIYI